MTLVDYGFFRVRPPEEDDSKILFFTNEKGEDWYELRRDVTEWDIVGRFVSAIFPTWVMVDAEGYVTNIEYDPSRLMPGDRRIIGTDLPENSIEIGQKYEDGKFV